VPVAVPGADAPMQAAQINGRAFVAFRPLCDALGVDTDSQAKKLRSRSWATTVLSTVVAADGRTREMLMVDRRTLTMWLATLDERRVSSDARDRVVAYQSEAADALDAYFNKRTAAPSMNQLDVLRAALDQIEAAQRDAARARDLAEHTEARLDAIEGRHDWFAAVGYAKLTGLPTNLQFVQRLGARASQLARANGIEPVAVQHQLYGTVNSLPRWVWDLAAEAVTS
ncbi:phage antirepressor N-terminal domain-containing protein, partial [Mycolicibacterium elephantis]|uniref:phage antirepressor N-terminal domain-containing protein n=1 Tax=Mycolicibacterium elephantis TaxID=81858 RepID=UPI000AB018CA